MAGEAAMEAAAVLAGQVALAAMVVMAVLGDQDMDLWEETAVTAVLVAQVDVLEQEVMVDRAVEADMADILQSKLQIRVT